MKFYSTTAAATLHTYSVNCGEYQSNAGLRKVAEAFAKFVQMPFDNVLALLKHHNNLTGFLVWENDAKALLERWTPNEERLLHELLSFMDICQCALRKDGMNMDPQVFHCVDLNSGRNFTWILSIC